MLAHFDEVIDEPDQAQAQGEQQRQEHRWGNGVFREQVGHEVGHRRRPEDDDAAHRRGAPLGQVRARTILTDELTPLQLLRQPYVQRHEEQAQAQCDNRRDEYSLHSRIISPCQTVTNKPQTVDHGRFRQHDISRTHKALHELDGRIIIR